MRAIHISFLEIPFQSIFSQKKINKILNFFLKVSMLKPRNCYPMEDGLILFIREAE